LNDKILDVNIYISDTFKSTRFKKKGGYDQSTLMLAVQTVLDGKFSSYKAAEMFGIPRSTIYDWVVKAKQTMCTRLNVSDNKDWKLKHFLICDLKW